VWGDDLMIVWGGVGPASVVDTGAMYDPATVIWAPVATVAAPGARGAHSAIWTGESMVVWGGAGEAYLNTGGMLVFGPDLGQDADGDGFVECGGDCNDADPDVHSLPHEVPALRFGADTVTLSWDAAPGAAAYDVLAGAVAELPVANAPSDACLESDLAATSVRLTDVPPPSTASWYLVRGRNSCGAGTYGAASSLVEQTSLACP
jgi:hypothetical protein